MEVEKEAAKATNEMGAEEAVQWCKICRMLEYAVGVC